MRAKIPENIKMKKMKKKMKSCQKRRIRISGKREKKRGGS